MRRLFFALGAALLVSVSSPTAVMAQPAPPPPPGFPDYVQSLDDAYNERNIASFGEFFQDDVKVFMDGALIASDRSSYLKQIQSEFDKNLRLSSLSWAQGSQLLVMQSVAGCIPMHPDPSTVYHGCRWARAVRYDLSNDHKISAVHILEADRAWNMHPMSK